MLARVSSERFCQVNLYWFYHSVRILLYTICPGNFCYLLFAYVQKPVSFVPGPAFVPAPQEKPAHGTTMGVSVCRN